MERTPKTNANMNGFATKTYIDMYIVYIGTYMRLHGSSNVYFLICARDPWNNKYSLGWIKVEEFLAASVQKLKDAQVPSGSQKWFLSRGRSSNDFDDISLRCFAELQQHCCCHCSVPNVDLCFLHKDATWKVIDCHHIQCMGNHKRHGGCCTIPGLPKSIFNIREGLPN